MPFTHTQVRGWQSASSALSQAIQRTAGQENNLDEVIPGASTDLLTQWAAILAKIESLHIECDRDLTIKTNSSGAPDKTISVKANTPIQFVKDAGETNPLGSVDVTKLYITLAAGASATLKIRCIVDPT